MVVATKFSVKHQGKYRIIYNLQSINDLWVTFLSRPFALPFPWASQYVLSFPLQETEFLSSPHPLNSDISHICCCSVVGGSKENVLTQLLEEVMLVIGCSSISLDRTLTQELTRSDNSSWTLNQRIDIGHRISNYQDVVHELAKKLGYRSRDAE